MSWLGKLFGTDAATEKVISTASGLLDNAFYTDQEEARDKAEMAKETHQFILKWLEATTGSRLARRVLAFNVAGIWSVQYLATQILSLVAIWSDDPKRLEASVKVLENSMEQTTAALMLVLGFYFAAPYLGDIASVALKKFGKVKEPANGS